MKPAPKLASTEAHPKPTAGQPEVCTAAPLLPQWQLTAGQCRTGAQAGQPNATFAKPAPNAEQAADHALAAMKAGCIDHPACKGGANKARPLASTS